MRWMNLEPTIQSEVSQKEKNKYHVLMHIYGIQKDDTDEPYLQGSNGESNCEQSCGDSGAKRGKDKQKEQH